MMEGSSKQESITMDFNIIRMSLIEMSVCSWEDSSVQLHHFEQYNVFLSIPRFFHLQFFFVAAVFKFTRASNPTFQGLLKFIR